MLHWNEPINTQAQQTFIETSWALNYDTITDLKKDADAVIVGTIRQVDSIERGDHDLVFTNFLVDVQQDLHHRTSAPGTQIILHQTGAADQTQSVEVRDDPLFSVGDQVVLFLHEYNPGHYYVLGGPQGRFHIHNGTVQSLESHIKSYSAPVSIDTFVAMVKAAK